jgi:hypothetical protein
VPRGEVGTAAAGPQGYKAKKARLQGLGKACFFERRRMCAT